MMEKMSEIKEISKQFSESSIQLANYFIVCASKGKIVTLEKMASWLKDEAGNPETAQEFAKRDAHNMARLCQYKHQPPS